jgi:hypothetical protein
MPYLNDAGDPLRVIPLTQAPASGHWFQLRQRIGFREFDGPEDARTNPTHWAPAHIPSDNPAPGNRTDLASVPWIFWSFIASYGRQSAPAILHDHQSRVASQLPKADRLAARKKADHLFRVGLRAQKVPLLRAWLMWTFVGYNRYIAFAPVRAALMLAETVIGAAVIYLSVILAFQNALWLLLFAVPGVVALLWGSQATLVIWGTYGFALVAPLALLQVVAVAPFWLLETLTRELIDRPFFDHHPDTQVGPFFRRESDRR